MPYRTITAENTAAALGAAVACARDLADGGAVPAMLVPSPPAAARARRALADGGGALGVRVATFSSWIADRWELFGDGRRLVSSAERMLLVRRAIGEAADGGAASGGALADAGAAEAGRGLAPAALEALGATPGTVDLVAGLAREALPWLADAGSSGEASLSDGERAVVAALARYAAKLRAAGLCELSEAAQALSGTLPASPVVTLGFDEPGCALGHLLDALSKRADVVRVDDACSAPDGAPGRNGELQSLLGRLFAPADGTAVEPTGAVRFLLPAGRYAAPALVARTLADAALAERAAARREGRAPLCVCAACREPAALFAETADFLARRGVDAAVSARTPFAQTGFGRAFLALAEFAWGSGPCAAKAADFALSPFSGVPQRAAWALDAAWRGDRTADHARIEADLRAASEVLDAALPALGRDDADAALAVLEERLRRMGGLDEAYRAGQLAAVACARRFAATCAQAGEPLAGALELLARQPVSSGAWEGASEGAAPDAPCEPSVLFASLADAAERPPCSCAVLVLCDLEASSYPVRPAEDAATLLLERLGLAACGDALAASRRRFFRALSCARDAVVCERVLSTADADEAYPAVMYEELIDCYRPDPTRMGDLDRATGLPQALVPFAERAGEDALHANLAPGDDASDAEAWEVPASGDVSPAARGRVVLPREGGSASGDRPATPVLSPSAIESYLECPCKWFSLRRLRLSEPDAGFGPLEMGSFSHGVLKSFYERFIEAGNAKVTPGNLEEARSLMCETFARHLAFQPERKRKANPLLPLTAFERAEAHGLERRLVSYLDREAALLPGFAPAYFELDFGAKEPFAYGGFELRGSVDRIDVNGRGQAVVIDYKGSLSPDYALASASPAATAGGAVLPHKVQALVYAQVARRLLGLEVVGALYVSYGRDGRVAGAFDRTFVGAADVPGIDAEACGAPGPAAEAVGAGSFAELADRVEEGIARAALSMGAGQVSPDPRGADPCGFCPVLACERRR